MELIHEFLASPYEAGGLVLDWPSVPPRTCVFVPLLVREGGVLGAVPLGFLDASLVSAGQTGALDAVVGPSSEVELALAEEEEDGSLRPVEGPACGLQPGGGFLCGQIRPCYLPGGGRALCACQARPANCFPRGPRHWITAEEGERLAYFTLQPRGPRIPT